MFKIKGLTLVAKESLGADFKGQPQFPKSKNVLKVLIVFVDRKSSGAGLLHSSAVIFNICSIFFFFFFGISEIVNAISDEINKSFFAEKSSNLLKPSHLS